MKKNYVNHMTLKTKIFFFNTLIFSLAILLFLGISIKSYTNEILSMEKKNTKREIELINNNLDTMFSGTEDYLRIIASNELLQQEMVTYTKEQNQVLGNLRISSAMSKIMSNIVSPNTRIAGVAVFVGQEMVYAGYDIDHNSAYKILGKDYLKRVASNQKPTWGDMNLLNYRDYRKEYVMPVSKIVMNKETGERLGLVSLFLNEENIRQIYEKSSDLKQKQYYILSGDYNIISSSQTHQLTNNVLEVLSLTKSNLAELQNNGQLLNEKEKQLYTVGTYEKFNWKIMSNTSMDSFFKDKQKMVISNVLILSVIVAAVFGGAYLISHTIMKPLYSLLETMNQISKGQMDRRASDPKGEIGILAKSFNQLMDKLQDSMEQIYIQQKQKRKSELQLLQSQIKPHFLYNAMETISSFVKLEEKEKALATIYNLSSFYRKSLNGGKEIIKISEEVEILENYFKIQCLRYENYMQYEIEIEKEVGDCLIPKLILQPLVENAIYHGIKQSVEKGIIIIRGYRKGTDIQLEVFDTGVGIDEAGLEKVRQELKRKDDKKDSFGLYNVNERIKLFFGSDYGIEFESLKGEYTQVTVCIPCIYE